MDKKHYQTKTSLGDLCLFYGFPGVAILAVSLIVAAKVGAEFNGDVMIKSGTFLGCNHVVVAVLLHYFYLLAGQFVR